jgi:hypothetical protein
VCEEGEAVPESSENVVGIEEGVAKLIVPCPLVIAIEESVDVRVATRIFGAVVEPTSNCPSVVICAATVEFPVKSTLLA